MVAGRGRPPTADRRSALRDGGIVSRCWQFSLPSRQPPRVRRPSSIAARKLKEICEQVEKHEMPMKIYVPLHPDSKLSDADRKTLCDWAKAERASASSRRISKRLSHGARLM